MAIDPQSKTGAQSKLGSAPTDFARDFARLFADLKFPAMPDMDAFLSANRKNMETLTAANRIALEGAQAVARRHMEIMQQSLAEMNDAVTALATTETPQAKAARQAELIKRAYEHAVANMTELRDLIQRSNEEAMQLLNKRFGEAMDEVKAMAEKAR
jgi:phasin family protein